MAVPPTPLTPARLRPVSMQAGNVFGSPVTPFVVGGRHAGGPAGRAPPAADTPPSPSTTAWQTPPVLSQDKAGPAGTTAPVQALQQFSVYETATVRTRAGSAWWWAGRSVESSTSPSKGGGGGVHVRHSATTSLAATAPEPCSTCSRLTAQRQAPSSP